MPTIAAVGDVRIFRDKPETALANVRDVFKQADIAFCQSESSYSDKGSKGSSGPRGASPVDLRGYPAFASVGFDVVSMASNHTMDWGQDAFLDAIERMRRDGMKVIGAGKNLEEARQPAIVECEGTRIAFLGYCSVAPKGYYAAESRTGVAPMRAIAHFEALEDDQPGTPAKIMTWPLQRDLDALVQDIKKVRQQVDIVAISLHWGVHQIRGLIADYQPVVARAAIDAGADIIIGHHPHILKGVEVYKGKAILYSIGDFSRDFNKDRASDLAWTHECEEVYKIYGTAFAGGQGAISNRFSMVAGIEFASGKIKRVSYRPVMIEREDDVPQPNVVSVTSARGEEIIQYMKDITREAGFDTKFRVEGESVIIET